MRDPDPVDGRRVFHRTDDGVSWTPYPDELRRSCHALATESGVWVVDPVDVPKLDDLLAAYGDVAGVAVLLDRHKRDAAVIANRHDVPVAVPSWFDGVAEDIDAPVERFETRLPDTAYEAIELVSNRFWQEAALFDGSTLVVPESLGTADLFTGGDGVLGVHPVMRPWPPRTQFGDVAPDRIRVGHGTGVTEEADAALADALANARRDMPKAYANALRMMVMG